jgi:hypothetical protein
VRTYLINFKGGNGGTGTPVSVFKLSTSENLKRPLKHNSYVVRSSLPFYNLQLICQDVCFLN